MIFKEYEACCNFVDLPFKVWVQNRQPNIVEKIHTWHFKEKSQGTFENNLNN